MALLSLAAMLFANGCAVGPDFRPPDAPEVTRLSPEPPQGGRSSGPESQAFVRSLDIPGQWWELFRCRALDALIRRAIEQNPDLDAARAAVAIADANAGAQRGGFFPQVSAGADSSWQKQQAANIKGSAFAPHPYRVNAGQISVSFLPDVFGTNRRKVESLEAESEARRYELEAAYLTLTSRLALAAIDEAALRDEMRAAETSIAIGREVLAILKQQLEIREVSKVDVSAQEAALAQLEQALPPLKKQLAEARDRMSALSGRPAGEGLPETFSFACLGLPAKLPLSLPSTIVTRRPDVRAAEASMHAATAEIGVAIANRLPQFNLTANAGASASAIASLASLSSPLVFWTLAGSASQLLFDGFSAAERQRAAEAGLDRAAALYRSAVLGAFQNVADVLQAIEADREAWLAAQRGEKAARTNLDLTRELLSVRQVSAQQLLTAQQLYAQALVASVRAKAARRRDTVLLFQALGGGWRDEGWTATTIAAGG